jgi:hypothetical protein
METIFSNRSLSMRPVVTPGPEWRTFYNKTIQKYDIICCLYENDEIMISKSVYSR